MTVERVANPTLPCEVIAFPLDRQVGRVRDVASKLLVRRTDKAVVAYRKQVSDAIQQRLSRAGVPEGEHASQIALFWRAVAMESSRQVHVGRSA